VHARYSAALYVSIALIAVAIAFVVVVWAIAFA
jgi:hypothetical protein